MVTEKTEQQSTIEMPVESDFKAPNIPLSLRLNDSGCHYNSIYNKIGKIVVKYTYEF
jgi:hypothetical protein